MSIFDDLQAEQDRLDELLAGLDEHQWAAPSGADGWSVADVVLHLAQSEEAVMATVAEARAQAPAGGSADRSPARMSDRPESVGVDEFAAQAVEAERAAGVSVLRRWRAARAAALAGLRSADPTRPLRWVAAPLKPATLATTRLAEHWAHGLDVTQPLGLDFPDSPRLRHIAWLAHRTLPYAFAGAGERPAAVSCVLTSPDGDEVWRFGPPGADSTISGPAGVFCRVAVRRLDAADSGLRATGPHAATALRLLRTYAA
jgi:uncharacterized protein (TIGR03084 family)